MISIIPLKAAPDHSLSELGDLLRDLLGEETIVRLADEGQTVVAEIAGVTIKVTLCEESVPAEIIDGPLAAAWYWEEAKEALAGHSAHFVVVVSDPRLPKIVPFDDGSGNEPQMEPFSESGVIEIYPEAPAAPPLSAEHIRYSVQDALLLTRVSLSLGSHCSPLAVYWDGSTSIHSWSAFENHVRR